MATLTLRGQTTKERLLDEYLEGQWWAEKCPKQQQRNSLIGDWVISSPQKQRIYKEWQIKN